MKTGQKHISCKKIKWSYLFYFWALGGDIVVKFSINRHAGNILSLETHQNAFTELHVPLIIISKVPDFIYFYPSDRVPLSAEVFSVPFHPYMVYDITCLMICLFFQIFLMSTL